MRNRPNTKSDFTARSAPPASRLGAPSRGLKNLALAGLAIVLLSAAAQARRPSDPPEELPKPPQYTQLTEFLGRVGASVKLSEADKAAYREEHAKVEAQFRRVWAPLEETYKELRQATKALEREGAGIERQIEFHNGPARQALDQTKPAQVDAYNRRADELNRQKAEFEEKAARTVNPLVERMNGQAAGVDRWLESAELKQFIEMSRGLIFGDSKALRQLKRIAAGEVTPEFGDPGLGSEGSGVVDPRGVRKMSPEERRAEIEKPRAQWPQKRKRKKEVPPPPRN
jgi:hypothetical protein